MDACRLNLAGASGSGTTTLGRALASHWSVPHADADDYYWVPTPTPYQVRRELPERLRLMEELFVDRPAWVLSGSVMNWGEPLIERFDAVVFLSLRDQTRMARLRAREMARYGAAIEMGGKREADHREFLDWAAQYEDPTFDGRSRVQHEAWVSSLQCPVLRLDSALGVDELVGHVVAWQKQEIPPAG